MQSVQAAWRLGQSNSIGNYVSAADKEEFTKILKAFAEKRPLHVC